MITYTTTDISNPRTNYYVENSWHKLDMSADNTIPDTATFTAPGGQSLALNKDYHLTLFYKVFVATDKNNVVYDSGNNRTTLNNYTFLSMGHNTTTIGIPMTTDLYVDLPTDEELGKDLLSGINTGSYINFPSNKGWWGSFKNDNWSNIFGVYAGQSGSYLGDYNGIYNVASITEDRTTMSVRLDDSYMPKYAENTDYLPPLLFTPIACVAQHTVPFSGFYYILGIEANS